MLRARLARRKPPGPSQRAHQGRTVHDGHLEVEDQSVRAVLAESCEGLPAVARCVDLVAVLKQGIGDHASDCGIVVDDKDARHGYSTAAACVPQLDTVARLRRSWNELYP